MKNNIKKTLEIQDELAISNKYCQHVDNWDEYKEGLTAEAREELEQDIKDFENVIRKISITSRVLDIATFENNKNL